MRLKSPTDTPVSVALLNGHAMLVGPEGRDVTPMFMKQALINGCIPAELEAEDMKQDAADPTEKDRGMLLRDVLREMRDAGVPLTGAGMPNRNAVSAAAGWNVSAVELTDSWNSI